MTSLCVTGYGSLDYAVSLDGFVEPDRTTIVRSRDPAAWPRCGGCPAYVARAVVGERKSARIVSWMGDNEEGLLYQSQLRDDGIDTSGIACIEASRSPTSLLVYQADGSCACLYDPALGGRECLTQTQEALIAGSSHVCVSVGPPHLVKPTLEACSETARFYWLAKNDAAAVTAEVGRLLSARADVVFCNSAERALIDGTQGADIIVETRGRDGVLVTHGDRMVTIDAQVVATSDTTGAGDTFAGAFIAAEMDGIDDPVVAAERAVQRTAAFLRERGTGEES